MRFTDEIEGDSKLLHSCFNLGWGRRGGGEKGRKTIKKRRRERGPDSPYPCAQHSGYRTSLFRDTPLRLLKRIWAIPLSTSLFQEASFDTNYIREPSELPEPQIPCKHFRIVHTPSDLCYTKWTTGANQSVTP